jgi:hypothetical protein
MFYSKQFNFNIFLCIFETNLNLFVVVESWHYINLMNNLKIE